MLESVCPYPPKSMRSSWKALFAEARPLIPTYGLSPPICLQEKLHELGVKIARRKVLKEEKQEQEFQKRAQALVKQKERRNHQRKVKREQLMTLYESALQAADELKQSQSSATIRGYVHQTSV